MYTGQSETFTGAGLCHCRPGEAAAQAQLAAFCDGGGLLTYEPGRNIPADAGTSGLSAALKFGTLSPRQAWAAAQGAKELARPSEQLASNAVWEQDLAWPESYQHARLPFLELAEGSYRPPLPHHPLAHPQG